MKIYLKKLIVFTLFFNAFIFGFGQAITNDFYNIRNTAGNGIRFWYSTTNPDWYLMSMNNTSEHQLSPTVTGFSIKSRMTTTAGNGWTWGNNSTTPIAALSNTGNFQLNQKILLDGVNGKIGIGTTSLINGSSLGIHTTSGLSSMNFKSGTNNSFWINDDGLNLGIGKFSSTIPSGGVININSTGQVGIANNPISNIGLSINSNYVRSYFQNSYIDIHNNMTSNKIIFSNNTNPTNLAEISWNGNAMGVAAPTESIFNFTNMKVGINTSPLGKLDVYSIDNEAIRGLTESGKAINGVSQSQGFSGYFRGGKFAIFPTEISTGYPEFSFGIHGTEGFYIGSTLIIKPVPYSSGNALSIDGSTNSNATAIKVNNTAPTSFSAKLYGGKFLIAREETSINPDFIVNELGNVSIGTSTVYGTPTDLYKLSVNGKVACKELKVDVSWADFVFDKEYKLLSLYEVEKYIAVNKHLPAVPSEAEVEANGLKVGEMQSITMQKIEELTLYIIQQQKVMDAQQKQIEMLIQQVNSLK